MNCVVSTDGTGNPIYDPLKRNLAFNFSERIQGKDLIGSNKSLCRRLGYISANYGSQSIFFGRDGENLTFFEYLVEMLLILSLTERRQIDISEIEKFFQPETKTLEMPEKSEIKKQRRIIKQKWTIISEFKKIRDFFRDLKGDILLNEIHGNPLPVYNKLRHNAGYEDQVLVKLVPKKVNDTIEDLKKVIQKLFKIGDFEKTWENLKSCTAFIRVSKQGLFPEFLLKEIHEDILGHIAQVPHSEMVHVKEYFMPYIYNDRIKNKLKKG